MNALDCPEGQCTLQQGDVISLGGRRHIVKSCNSSGARIVPLIKRRVTVTPKFGEAKTFEKAEDSVVISKNIDRAEVIARLGEQGWKDFLGGVVPPGLVAEKQKQTEEQGEQNMATKAKVNKKRARGGLAADAATAKKAARKTTTGDAPKYSFAGRPAFIEKCIKDDMKDSDILEAVKAKYPGSSAGNVNKTIFAKRAALKEEPKAA